jgi:putative ABC transport system ATP-binding protein
MLSLNNVSKIYNQGTKNKVTALSSANLTIEKGEKVLITGPSGSGKSTLLHIIGCLDKSTQGEYFIDGKNINEYSQSQMADIRNKKFGFVLQNFGLIPYRNVIDNVSLPLIINKSVKISEIKNKSRKALESVGLKGFDNKKISELSGGERQRVAIARAITADPEIILADEPTGSLDGNNKDIVIELFNKLNESGITIVMVSHDLSITKNFNRHYVLKNGELKNYE